MEATWALVEPKEEIRKVKRIAICSLYVSSASKSKTKTIVHVVQTIHFLRSQHDHDISVLLGGDLIHLNINPILQCYCALEQLVTKGTRDSAILEFLITDFQGYYHPPSCISSLEVDENQQGRDSDHNKVMFSLISFPNNRIVQMIFHQSSQWI